MKLVRLVLKTSVITQGIWNRTSISFTFTGTRITGSFAGLIARFIALSRSDLLPNNVQLTLKLSWNIILAGGCTTPAVPPTDVASISDIMRSRQTKCCSSPLRCCCSKINCRSIFVSLSFILVVCNWRDLSDHSWKFNVDRAIKFELMSNIQMTIWTIHVHKMTLHLEFW